MPPLLSLRAAAAVGAAAAAAAAAPPCAAAWSNVTVPNPAIQASWPGAAFPPRSDHVMAVLASPGGAAGGAPAGGAAGAAPTPTMRVLLAGGEF
jgi:hypothetical protein